MTNGPLERHIPFEGVFNFRDLGGYRTRDGHSTRWRRLFRSAELDHMSDRDVERARNHLAISSVIDLRDARDFQSNGGGRLAKLIDRVHHVPMLADTAQSISTSKGFSSAHELYFSSLKSQPYAARIIEALDLIAEPDSGPTVFTCWWGKDRTGVLAAVLLALLGVDDQDISQDYAATAAHLEAVFGRARRDPAKAEVMEAVPPFMLEARPDTMHHVLRSVNHEFGSMRGYVVSQGADETLLRRLEDSLLE